MRAGAACLVLISACGASEAVLIELTAVPGLGRAESLTLTVVQGQVLATQSFRLDGGMRQTVGLTSAGMTEGQVVVVAQALRGVTGVESSGEARVTLSAQRPVATVSLTLRALCDGGTCLCSRANCLGINAACGSVPDGCGGIIDCGGCPSGQSCTADGGGHACSSSACSALPCGKVCGLRPDGCGRILDCGRCDGGG